MTKVNEVEEGIQKILDKHKQRQTCKRIPLRDEPSVEVLGSIQMAVEGTKYFFERMTIVYVPEKDQHYWVDYKNTLPPVKFLTQNVQSSKWSKKVVDNESADVIINALEKWKDVQGSHLNSFTFLVAYCLAQGVDLFELGLVSK